MQRRSTKEPTEQAEAKAIGNLLEIGLKMQQEASNWQEKQREGRFQRKHRTQSHFFIKGQKRNDKYCLKHTYLLTPRQNPTINDREKQSKAQLTQSSNDIIPKDYPQQTDGHYWLSKVNWMEDTNTKDNSHKFRLHKKRSVCFENHGKAARQKNRYDNPERTFSRQLKKNLVLSFSKQPKQQKLAEKLPSPSIQEYVRLTFDKFQEKHRQDSASSPYKQTQHEKTTMIRKLLNNLQSIKQLPLKPQTQRTTKSNKNQIKQVVSALPTPRKNYQTGQQRFILDLNEEAEKVYHNRSINQLIRKSSISKH